jgi:preprotein translocase subunit SecG
MLQFLETPLTILHIFACILLMVIVLLQPGQAGGLGALTGAAATQVFGGRGATSFLAKATWVTATTFFLTSITLAYLSSSSDESLEQRARSMQMHKQAPPPTPAPATPKGAPPAKGAK